MEPPKCPRVGFFLFCFMISFWDRGKMSHGNFIAFKDSLTKMLSMLCWLFIATQPTRKAFCNGIELLSHNEVPSESLITFHVWLLHVLICHCICECLWCGLSVTASVPQAPGSLDGKGWTSDAWAILMPHPESWISVKQTWIARLAISISAGGKVRSA